MMSTFMTMLIALLIKIIRILTNYKNDEYNYLEGRWWSPYGEVVNVLDCLL